MAPALAYPVRVDARLDAPLSRWLWLVKWFLAIPHYFVLAFLWLAFVVLTVVAFFAILFTGRYPKTIFDFNIGVLRWTWRVDYYALGAAGTDRYPPFSLGEEPDYPAVLHIEYPGELSRGLALVKWWLLAIPHYLVIGLFAGGSAYLAWQTDRWEYRPAGLGLIGFLVLFAVVHLLFTGRYPRELFDLVLGLNRWILRVAAYAGLMTDQYPPFRLDMGGTDPGTLALSAPPAGPSTSASATPSERPNEPSPTGTPSGAPESSNPHGTSNPGTSDPPGTNPVGTPNPSNPYGPSSPYGTTPAAAMPPAPGAPSTVGPGIGSGGEWTAGRIIAVIFGALLILFSLPLLGGGATAIVFDRTQRDADGMIYAVTEDLSTSGYAVTASPFEIEVDGWQWVMSTMDAFVGDVKLRVVSETDKPVFVGLGRQTDVASYLEGVDYDVIIENEVGREVVYDHHTGGAPASPPVTQQFWLEQSSGTGEQAMQWRLEEGEWNFVVMNADASRSVAAEATAGAELPALGGIGVAMLVGGLILLAGGALLLYVALRPRGTRRSGQAMTTA